MGSRGVFQPVGQKRLTNIAVVRLKKGGHRFEIACYRNKVQDWRAGIEKDVDEVLQTTAVFTNVSKGVLAKEKELQAAFGTTDQKAICLEILAKGDLQVAEEERKQQLEHLFKDVAGVLVDKCVNPENGRPYTMALLERALRDVHFNPDPKRSAKQQALEAIPLLQQRFPIQRAKMRLKLAVPLDFREELEQLLAGAEAQQEAADIIGNSFTVTTQVDPGMFRQLHSFMATTTRGRGRVEVASFAVMAEGATAQEFAAASNSSMAVTPAATLHPPTQQIAGLQLQQSGSAALGAAEVPQAHSTQGVGTVQHGMAPSARGRERAGPGRVSGSGAAAATGDVVYARGSIAGLPEEHASRRERFAELDQLQPGWTVELRKKGDTVEAVFFAPGTEECVGAFAVARRQALAASKAAAAQ